MPVLVLAVGVILGRIPGGTKPEQGLEGIYPALLKVLLWDQGFHPASSRRSSADAAS